MLDFDLVFIPDSGLNPILSVGNMIERSNFVIKPVVFQNKEEFVRQINDPLKSVSVWNDFAIYKPARRKTCLCIFSILLLYNFITF
jgi:hypothetical protein